MGTKWKKKLVCYIATIAMLLSVVNIPALGYATQDEPSYGIYVNRDDGEGKIQLMDGWNINISELEGDPWDYFYVIPYDKDDTFEYEAEWESSDPSVAECIDTGNYDEVKIQYLSAGYTTINALVDGKVVASFGMTVRENEIVDDDFADEPSEYYGGYGIYFYDYDEECMAELTGEWTVNLATLEGDPCDYFYVRPFDEEAEVDYSAEWESSDPSVAECVDTGSNEEIKIQYLSEGYTTIRAIIDGEVVNSFGLCVEDYNEDEGDIDEPSDNEQSYGIFTYDYDADEMVEIQDAWQENIATLPGDPVDYFYVRPNKEDANYDYTAEWISSDPSVAECIDTGSHEEVKIEYIAKGTTTISALIDGGVVASFDIEVFDLGVQCASIYDLEYDDVYYSPVYSCDDFKINLNNPIAVQAYKGMAINGDNAATDAYWYIENEDVASLSEDEDGNTIITGLEEGTTTLTVIDKKDSDNIVVYTLFVGTFVEEDEEDEPSEYDGGYGIYFYDYDEECMAELTGEWIVNLATLEGDPCDYFYVRPFDEEAEVDYTAEWESSDPSVAECVDTGSNEEIKIQYLSEGYTTIRAIIDGEVVNSFGLCVEDYNEDEDNCPLIDEAYVTYSPYGYEEPITDYIYLDPDDKDGRFNLLPYDTSKPVIVSWTSADGTEESRLVEFKDAIGTVEVISTADDGSTAEYIVTLYQPTAPLVDVGFWIDGYEVGDPAIMDGDYSYTYNIPYSYDRTQPVKVSITHLDGKITTPEMSWDEDGIGTATFESIVDGVNREYTISLFIDDPSSETGCNIRTYVENENGAIKNIYMDWEDAVKGSEAEIVIPYGAEDNAYLFIDPWSSYAKIEGYDPIYDAEVDESFGEKVSVGQTKTFTITAQDGTKQEYSIKFVESDGYITDVNMRAEFYGWRVDLEFEEHGDKKTAEMLLPYWFSTDDPLYFIDESTEFIIHDIYPEDVFYINEDGTKTIEFEATSPNGKATQDYVINLIRDTDGSNADLKSLNVYYYDENDIEYEIPVDITEATTENGATIILPDNADIARDYVNVLAETNNYATFINLPEDAMEMGDPRWSLFSFDLIAEDPVELTFSVESANKENVKDYKLTIMSRDTVCDHEGTIVIDNAVPPTCTEDGLTEGTHCSECGIIIVPQQGVLAKGHNMTYNPGYPATCTKYGMHEYWYCTDCYRYYADEYGHQQHGEPPYIEVTGHTMTKHAAVAPECEKDGNIEYYTCDVCKLYFLDAEGKVETTAEGVIDAATDHDYEATVIDATCAEGGYTEYTCKCGDSYIGDYTNPRPHSKVIDKAVAATYFKTGLTEGSHCKVCNEVLVEQKTVAKKKYNLVPKTITVNLSTAENGYNNVKVSWSKVSGAAGYKVWYKKASANKWSGPFTVTGKTSYVTKELTGGAKYTFRVRPYVKSGTTVVTSTKYKQSASIYTLKKLNTPKVVKNGSKVKVSWNNINGETGYQISKSTNKTGTNIVSTYKTTTGKSKLITAKKGVKYYYKVRAYKNVKVGKTTYKVYGPWSKVKDFKRR